MHLPPLSAFLHLSYPVGSPPPPSKPSSFSHAFSSSSNSNSSSSNSPDESTQYYLKGPDDLAYVFSALVFFIVLREIAMKLVLAPIARRYVVDAGGGSSSTSKASEGEVVGDKEMRARSKASTRFAEQGWSLLYYTVYWSFGMSLFLNSTSYRQGHLIPFDFDAIWAMYPQVGLTGPQKFYYLTQLAFWIHQMITLNIEARRSDHWQMFAHHVITLGLMGFSYLCNVTAIGTVVLVLMDFGDILLPLAKMLRYLGLTTLTDATFVAFLLSWLVTRQIGLLLVTISVAKDTSRSIEVDHPEIYSKQLGPYDIPFNRFAVNCFVGSLGTLWVLMCIWFAVICRIAFKVVMGASADDVRSDAGDSEPESFEDEEEGEDDESLILETPGAKEKELDPLRTTDVRKRK